MEWKYQISGLFCRWYILEEILNRNVQGIKWNQPVTCTVSKGNSVIYVDAKQGQSRTSQDKPRTSQNISKKCHGVMSSELQERQQTVDPKIKMFLSFLKSDCRFDRPWLQALQFSTDSGFISRPSLSNHLIPYPALSKQHLMIARCPSYKTENSMKTETKRFSSNRTRCVGKEDYRTLFYYLNVYNTLLVRQNLLYEITSFLIGRCTKDDKNEERVRIP
ncbi:hypothetical protein OUZ56_022606 [Daphnia magna]|uniref:Uncharacterized protein n=1 Tax=Daphnia magna TaxID=35525 RepID=A0ABR0AWY9_9CRUS|nr:hypothetical protein OUZ56_022606 [Daphnia magna]